MGLLRRFEEWILDHGTDARGSGHPSVGLESVCEGVAALAGRKVGALVAFERRVSLAFFKEAGDAIDANASGVLLETIFAPGGWLHHGAVVIGSRKVEAARCLLPLSDAPEHAHLGLRKRAALGLMEETDAVVVSVSEGSGGVSLAADGRLEAVADPKGLAYALVRLGVEVGPRRGEPERRSAEEIRTALEAFLRRASEWRMGALVAVEPGPGSIYGVPVDARVSADILQALFSSHAPLSRGGAVIEDGRLAQAACDFPLSPPASVPERLRTRYRIRAGVGLSLASRALVAMVSAESGEITLARRGRLVPVSFEEIGAALLDQWPRG